MVEVEVEEEAIMAAEGVAHTVSHSLYYVLVLALRSKNYTHNTIFVPGGGSSYGAGGSGGGGFSGGGGGFQNSNLGGGLNTIDFSQRQLVPFEKDFYIEHPDVTQRPEAEANAWRASKQIVVVGDGVPKPCLTFEEASMPEYVLSEVIKCGFDKPTPIQSQGWPMALKGKNMVGISATGSGKTLAFLLPAMIHINAQVSSLLNVEICYFCCCLFGSVFWIEAGLVLSWIGFFLPIHYYQESSAMDQPFFATGDVCLTVSHQYTC